MTSHTTRARRGLTRRSLLRCSRGVTGLLTVGGFSGLLGLPAQAKFLPDPGSVVETRHGKVRGGVADGIHIFRGIPYGGRRVERTASCRRAHPPHGAA